ncbi:MAG: UDP-N-acetylmuramoyl-L-alanyl-D-glutamate--2,6-diaminopimelate ligase [Calditrichia bacterium]
MMVLEKLLEQIPWLRVSGDLHRTVRNLHYDSRRVAEGDAFIAVRGFATDGHRFLQSAYQKGARVFFVEEPVEMPDSTVVQLANTRLGMMQVARALYQFPDRKLKLIGITGTNGKTTTAFLIQQILKSAGWKPGLLTTIAYQAGEEMIPAERTTPESVDLIRLFSEMARNGKNSAVMEVSSHALALNRVAGLKYTAGIFTNLGRDHLDFHQTEENYYRAKRQLFESLDQNSVAVLNMDDRRFNDLCAHTEADVFSYSINNQQAGVWCKRYFPTAAGIQMSVQTPYGEMVVSSSLLGKHNASNILAAIATALGLGIHPDKIATGIQELKAVPGRCEVFQSPEGWTAYVDYAHTPDALRQILKAVQEAQPAQLRVVFGAGGNRDAGKRPLMGRAAADFADEIILTNDNPRDEDPLEIIRQIQEGISSDTKVDIIPDRREAIREALRRCKKGDAVVIAGKGHEPYQEISGNRHHFSDREEIEKYLQKQKIK